MTQGRRYWLMKSEPSAFSIQDLETISQANDLLGWRAELSGAQFHARDGCRRPGAFLP